MSSQRLMTARLTTSLSTLFCALVLASRAYSAEYPAIEATQPVEELVELEEVRVRGKLVANAVITVENRVFRLYNQLNEDNRYDVHCRDVRARDSLALLRICTPEFMSGNWAPALMVTSSGGRGFGIYSGCGGMGAMSDASGNVFSTSSCSSGAFGSMSAPFHTTNYFGSAGLPSAAARRVVASPERIAEFKQTMARVMNSEPALQGMATELIGMYREVERVQARYTQLQEDRRAAQKARREAARARGVDPWPPHPRAP